MLLVVGQYHSSLLNSLNETGEEYQVLKDAKRYGDISGVDFSNEDSILKLVRLMVPQPSAAIALYEQYVPICAKINAILNTHSLSHRSAMLCTDKVLMREALGKYDGISPNFEEVTGLEQAMAFTDKYGFPVMVKPANLSKSMLVTKCTSRNDLKNALYQIEQDAPRLYEKYTLGEKPKFIIEEFMEGSIHTVAAFADATGKISCAPGVVDNVSASDIGFDDSFIYSRRLPSLLSQQIQEQMFVCAVKGMKALDMRSTAGHVELILTEHGPRIIEIGARLGGYRPRMYKASYGIDLLQQAVRVAEGKEVLFEGDLTSQSCVFELFPETEGKFKGVAGLSNLDQSLFSYFSIKPESGDMVGPAKRGYKAAAVIIVNSSIPEEFETLCRMIGQLRIKVNA